MYQRTRLIAEIGQAHDGSVSVAHAYIDAVADAGVDAIKFQIHFADDETTVDDSFRPGAETHDRTRFDYWKRIEFSTEQWHSLAKHVNERGCEFFASCFSERAYQLANELGVRAAKISSGEVIDRDWPKELIRAKDTIYVSTGMSGWQEIDDVMSEFCGIEQKLVLMQCTSAYPSEMREIGLNICDEFRKRYGVRIGLSDHSGTPYPSMAAISKGVDAIEVHVIFDRQTYTPDTTSSVTIEELKEIVRFRDAFQVMISNPVDKYDMAKKTADLRRRFGKSLALRKNLVAGEEIKETNLTLKRPGTGLISSDRDKVIGKFATHPIPANRLIRWSDVKKKETTD